MRRLGSSSQSNDGSLTSAIASWRFHLANCPSGAGGLVGTGCDIPGGRGALNRCPERLPTMVTTLRIPVNPVLALSRGGASQVITLRLYRADSAGAGPEIGLAESALVLRSESRRLH